MFHPHVLERKKITVLNSEQEYIAQRRLQANNLSDKYKKAWEKYPIQKGKVVFSAFEGDGGFCCNPRYIAEELHKQYPESEIVWLTKNTSKSFPDYIKVYEYNEENMVYHLSTAQVWIDNYRKPWGTLKREGQFYIQTWHASLGFKAVGLYRGKLFPEIARLVSESDSALADYFVSNSDYCDRVYPKKLLYNGPTIRTGSPRVDCLINERDVLSKTIREKYNITLDTKILLFAPTFRGGNQKGAKKVIAEAPNIDFDRLIEALKSKTGSDWKVFLRLHPQLSAKLDEMPLNETSADLIDVSQADDISEIMAACDLIVTDYSSCAFDALFADIPVLLYADDVEEYIQNRGTFMWEKGELPFLMAQTNDELIENVKRFDIDDYKKSAKDFMDKQGISEDGHASERVVEKILQYMNK